LYNSLLLKQKKKNQSRVKKKYSSKTEKEDKRKKRNQSTRRGEDQSESTKDPSQSEIKIRNNTSIRKEIQNPKLKKKIRNYMKNPGKIIPSKYTFFTYIH
jgi:hypothetical protein